MKKAKLSAAIIFVLSIFCTLSALAQSESMDADLADPNVAISAQRLIPLLKSKAEPKRERLQALHSMYNAKESLSKPQQIEFWRGTKTVASDRKEDARLRADAIWALGGMGMLLKHDKTWTQQDISMECQFLLQAAVDQSENLQVRRGSIVAMGDLKMKEAVPVVIALLADSNNLNLPEIARSASIALAELEPNEAIQPVGQILSNTSDRAVFGSAAYALGRTKSRDAIPLLVENRLRLNDNLSVDNAIEAMSETVLEILKEPSDPNTVFAIKATQSLWREEQKAEYTPILYNILADRDISLDVRRETLKRLIEDADALPLAERKQQMSAILYLIEGEESFRDEIYRMRQILSARILPITRIESHDEEGVQND